MTRNRPAHARIVLVGLALAGLAPLAFAQVYRCPATDGRVIYSDRPCTGTQPGTIVIAAPAPTSAPAAAASAGEGGIGLADKLRQASEEERRGLFALLVTTQLVQAGNAPCATATRTFYQGRDSSGTEHWSMTCNGGKSYALRWADARGGYRMEIDDCSAVRGPDRPTCFSTRGLKP